MERSHSRIDLDERRKIARWRTAGLTVGAIAEQLGRHRSTATTTCKLALDTPQVEVQRELTTPSATRIHMRISSVVLETRISRKCGQAMGRVPDRF